MESNKFPGMSMSYKNRTAVANFNNKVFLSQINSWPIKMSFLEGTTTTDAKCSWHQWPALQQQLLVTHQQAWVVVNALTRPV